MLYYASIALKPFEFVLNKLSVDEAVAQMGAVLLLDVRSPAEFEHAHLPGALSLPLFTNDERQIIGTLYKQDSKQKAIKAGLAFFGPKMLPLVEQVEILEAQFIKQRQLSSTAKPTLLVHCWRGGMRSAAVAWLLNLYGFDVYTLAGGYKAYRGWALKQFNERYRFEVLGGCTGSGKTALLKHLALTGKQVIDLEGIAGHKGSAFGNIGLPKQPSQEQFENDLAFQLHQKLGTNQPIFIEDESQRIGTVNLPMAVFAQMRQCPLWFLQIPFEERLRFLVADYGKGDTEALINAIVRIKKRLGGLEAKTAINHLLEGDLSGCFAILLQYYDKCYTKNIHNMRPETNLALVNIECTNTDVLVNAQRLLAAMQPAS